MNEDEIKIPEKEEKEDEDVPYIRLSPMMRTGIALGVILVIGLGIYFAVHFYQEWKENQTVTVAKVEKQMDPKEMNYDDYVAHFAEKGIKPIASYVYNVEVPEKERAAVDPMYNDQYIGYSENKTLNASLFPTEDGNLLILYNPKNKVVFSVAQWDKDYKSSLEISKLMGEKAELTAKAVKESNPSKKQDIEKIKEMNNQLLKLAQKNIKIPG